VYTAHDSAELCVVSNKCHQCASWPAPGGGVGGSRTPEEAEVLRGVFIPPIHTFLVVCLTSITVTASKVARVSPPGDGN